jgi:hypothetical protein
MKLSMHIPMPALMTLPLNFSLVRCVLAASAGALFPLSAAAADTAAGCNQMGREVALRAAEQMQADFDAAARTELAAIAEAVCLEFTVPAAASASSSAPAAASEAPATDAVKERREAFGLEIIPPEERVRRPGLKRL